VLRSGCRLLVQGGQCSVHRSEQDPPAGWRSPGYGLRVGTPTVRVRSYGRAPHEFVTFLSAELPDTRLSAALDELRALRLRLAGAESAVTGP
jgi:hypothetical protein